MRKYKRKRKRKRICGITQNANEYASAKVYVNATENANVYVVTQKKTQTHTQAQWYSQAKMQKYIWIQYFDS